MQNTNQPEKRYSVQMKEGSVSLSTDVVMNEHTVIFKGSPEEVSRWLEDNEAWVRDCKVLIGRGQYKVAVKTYSQELQLLQTYDVIKEVVNNRLPAMTRSDEIHANADVMAAARKLVERSERDRKKKHLQVMELVREAIDFQDPNAHADKIAAKIVDLF